MIKSTVPPNFTFPFPFPFSQVFLCSRKMKWDMEIEEIEAVLEKIWDLHDKLSDAIHSITRAHFLDSIKSLRKSDKKKQFGDAAGDESRSGFVFVKDFRAEESESAIQEAKSLNAIRTALENLEDQLDFLHTVQIQQRAERDAAIARLEQSRIILAMRLAEHHGKKYKVIEEALAFVGDVDTGRFVSPENLYGAPVSPSSANKHEGKASDILIKVLFSSFDFAKRSLNFKHMGGILNNAALFAVSMLVMLHLHPVARKEPSKKQKDNIKSSINSRKIYQLDVPSSHGCLGHLDVLLGRG